MPVRRSELLPTQSRHFDYKPITACYSIPSDREDTYDDHVQTLFTKIADDKYPLKDSSPPASANSSVDIGRVLNERNPFEDNDYLRKIGDF